MDEAARSRRKEELAVEIKRRQEQEGDTLLTAWFNFLTDAIIDIEDRLITLERSVDYLKKQTGD